jgi:adenylate cyclase
MRCKVLWPLKKKFQARNVEIPESRRMEFRIGINLGDVIQGKERIYGDGVNIAARLEGLAKPGEHLHLQDSF